MRAYLPISHSDLSGFLASQSFDAVQVFAPTPAFINENLDCFHGELFERNQGSTKQHEDFPRELQVPS